MANKNPERRAAELLDEYIGERLLGRSPGIDQYLSRCPVSERGNLQEAFEGLELVVEHQCTQIDDAFIDDTLARIQAIRRKKRLFADWQTQFSQWNANMTKDPIGDLSMAFQIPLSEMAREVATSRYAWNQPTVRFRGASGGSGRNKGYIDDARITLTEKRLDLVAEDTLRQAGVDRLPVDLRQVASNLYLCVREVPLDGVDGCIVSNGEMGAVLVNTLKNNPYRRRFTLGHEIGHFILHRHMRSHADTDDALDDYDSQEETEANIFSSMLLMPGFLLPSNFGAEKPSFDQAERLEQVCEVSLAAALRRVVRQSHWGCAMVVTKDGVLKWSVKSQFFEGWITSRPHPWSVAARLAQSIEMDEATDTVPAQTWLEGLEEDEDSEEQVLREHSRRFGNGYVYTLLTLPHQD